MERHDGSLAGTVPSQQEHYICALLLFSPVWGLSRYSGVLPHNKDMHLRNW